MRTSLAPPSVHLDSCTRSSNSQTQPEVNEWVSACFTIQHVNDAQTIWEREGDTYGRHGGKKQWRREGGRRTMIRVGSWPCQWCPWKSPFLFKERERQHTTAIPTPTLKLALHFKASGGRGNQICWMVLLFQLSLEQLFFDRSRIRTSWGGYSDSLVQQALQIHDQIH